MELIALGTFFSGSSASPAATPISSVPWKEKPATMKIARMDSQPPTNGASPVVQFINPGDVPPMPRISIEPQNRNTKTVITLMDENTYSLSPKERVDK